MASATQNEIPSTQMIYQQNRPHYFPIHEAYSIFPLYDQPNLLAQMYQRYLDEKNSSNVVRPRTPERRILTDEDEEMDDLEIVDENGVLRKLTLDYLLAEVNRYPDDDERDLRTKDEARRKRLKIDNENKENKQPYKGIGKKRKHNMSGQSTSTRSWSNPLSRLCGSTTASPTSKSPYGKTTNWMSSPLSYSRMAVRKRLLGKLKRTGNRTITKVGKKKKKKNNKKKLLRLKTTNLDAAVLKIPKFTAAAVLQIPKFTAEAVPQVPAPLIIIDDDTVPQVHAPIIIIDDDDDEDDREITTPGESKEQERYPSMMYVRQDNETNKQLKTLSKSYYSSSSDSSMEGVLIIDEDEKAEDTTECNDEKNMSSLSSSPTPPNDQNLIRSSTPVTSRAAESVVPPESVIVPQTTSTLSIPPAAATSNVEAKKETKRDRKRAEVYNFSWMKGIRDFVLRKKKDDS